MPQYIDGYVFPLRRDQVDVYQKAAEQIAKIWREHGALAYKEFLGDDLQMAGTRSFVEMGSLSDDEVVVFGWVAFSSRESRDLAHEKIAADPRMSRLVEPLIDPANTVFNAERMACAGFRPFVSVVNEDLV